MSELMKVAGIATPNQEANNQAKLETSLLKQETFVFRFLSFENMSL